LYCVLAAAEVETRLGLPVGEIPEGSCDPW
jgi:hypothetical protein